MGRIRWIEHWSGSILASQLAMIHLQACVVQMNRRARRILVRTRSRQRRQDASAQLLSGLSRLAALFRTPTIRKPDQKQHAMF